MALLAIYPRDNLLFANKVLTHAEDIQRHVQALDARLWSLPLPDLPCSAAPEALQACLPVQPELVTLAHAEVFHHDAPPAWAEQGDADAQPVHWHAQPTARWLLQGGGSFCLFAGSEMLYLDCSAGDLLLLPAGLPHAFLPRVGQPGALLRLAASARALDSLPSIDCSLRGLQPLD